MQSQDVIIEILNDLIAIHYDRKKGYERAADEAEDETLREQFHLMAAESKQALSELQAEVTKLGGEAENKASTGGKLYRMWMNIYHTMTGRDRSTVLGTCEEGENVALVAYVEALKFRKFLPENLQQLLSNHHTQLVKARDTIAHLGEEVYSQ